MKSFIKHILIFLLLMVFVTMLFDNIQDGDFNSQSGQVQENIDFIENQVQNGNSLPDGLYPDNEIDFNQNSNIISSLMNSLANFFTVCINFFIKFIMSIISAFIS